MWEPVSDGGASLMQIGSKKNRYALMASYKSLILKLLSIINWLVLFLIIVLADFLKTNLTKIAVICVHRVGTTL